MWRVKSKSTFPPQGWLFYQPETNWRPPMPMVDDFNTTVRKIIAHRSANPRFNLSVDFETVSQELENFTCARLKFDTTHCELKKKVNPAMMEPSSSSSSKSPSKWLKSLGAGLAEVKKWANGASVLTDWLGSGGVPVSRKVAQKRANVCLSCPLNDTGEWTFSDEIASRIKSQRQSKTALNLSLEKESEIGHCSACGCHLPLKVWVPLETIHEHTSSEVYDKLDPACWIKTEQEKYPLLVVLPFCSKDYSQAMDMLRWIQELGGCKNNDILLLGDFKMDKRDTDAIHNLAEKSFRKVESIRTPYSLPNESWPIGPNWMFETALRYVYEHYNNPFYWLEPDCVPLKPGWLERLESEYYKSGKPFMGAIVHSSGQANLPGDHLTGCAIYPNNAHEYLEHIYGSPKAFDMESAETVVPLTHNTRLHHHFWGQKNFSPTFRKDNQPDNPRNTLLLKTIPKEAVIFHRSKDGSLIKLLRTLK